ncbi:AMP-dependent synthetase/ligase [Desulforhopalus singaporensis]|uniref:Long-chain acyl-CoA synthetase n=1 Tax=Desulforhopalus singaporensis TaxID=91360 RepID=A0A1H0L5C5_9BACT|nr:long-chain fatty acid--CoA ligase [Desulforhopalus singaporensis]SDO63181.1 long-chain acyl-CoA synthetase [Desulforhopalus singaporensis]
MNIMSYPSIPAVLRENAEKYSGRPAISYKENGTYCSLSYGEFYERFLKLARGLLVSGITPGDRVAIFSENRMEWAISDFGIQSCGAVSVPIYATNTNKQAAYAINHSGAKIVFCSTSDQYRKLVSVKDQLSGVELVVSYESFPGDSSLPLSALDQFCEIDTPLADEDRNRIEGLIDGITLQDLLTIIYTSGTTGVPKGVELTQRNVMCNAQYGVEQLGMHQDNMTTLSFLPLSHVLERTGGYYVTLLGGNHLVFAENVAAVMDNMTEVRPTTVVSVPRLFEKIYTGIHESVEQMPALRRKIFNRAVAVGREYVNKKFIKKESLGFLDFRYRFYDKLVFKKIRERFGGRLAFFLCGGAPLDKTVNEFMWIIGTPVFNGYGLTETSPAVTISGAGKVRFDSVGKVLPETEVKLAEDGELLVKGPQLMRGYYRDEAATAAAFDGDWFKTGDIARIDEEGFVYIVDRKKELIVTAGGKNIAPQPIENELKLDRYISQAIMFGDRKPYLTALLVANAETLVDYAREQGIDYDDIEDLVGNIRIKQLYAERIAAVNRNFPSYKTIKYFAVLPREFSIEGGELTPTLKLKRKFIYEKYKDIADDLYELKGSAVIAPGKNS